MVADRRRDTTDCAATIAKLQLRIITAVVVRRSLRSTTRGYERYSQSQQLRLAAAEAIVPVGQMVLPKLRMAADSSMVNQ